MAEHDEVWKRNEIDSPCQKMCVIHDGTGFCIGCYRTRDEIAAWSAISQGERDTIRAALPARAPMLRGRRNRKPKPRPQ